MRGEWPGATYVTEPTFTPRRMSSRRRILSSKRQLWYLPVHGWPGVGAGVPVAGGLSGVMTGIRHGRSM
jgi:hypothetical protein